MRRERCTDVANYETCGWPLAADGTCRLHGVQQSVPKRVSVTVEVEHHDGRVERVDYLDIRTDGSVFEAVDLVGRRHEVESGMAIAVQPVAADAPPTSSVAVQPPKRLWVDLRVVGELRPVDDDGRTVTLHTMDESAKRVYDGIRSSGESTPDLTPGDPDEHPRHHPSPE